jgi:hypothetical protein
MASLRVAWWDLQNDRTSLKRTSDHLLVIATLES